MLVSCKRNEAQCAINDRLVFYNLLNSDFAIYFFSSQIPYQNQYMITHDSIRYINFVYKYVFQTDIKIIIKSNLCEKNITK